MKRLNFEAAQIALLMLAIFPMGLPHAPAALLTGEETDSSPAGEVAQEEGKAAPSDGSSSSDEGSNDPSGAEPKAEPAPSSSLADRSTEPSPPPSSPSSAPAPVNPENWFRPLDDENYVSPFSFPGNQPDWIVPPTPESGPAPDEPSDASPLLKVARKVVNGVLLLRVYDAFGLEIASGAGAFIQDSGVVLADASLVPPEFDDQVAYITAVDGLGKAYRISGVWKRDLKHGILLLQADADEVQAIEILGPALDLTQETPVAVVAMSPKRGLLLADAVVQPKDEQAVGPWLTVTGQDSRAAVGSPILDLEGRIVAFAAMSLPLDEWTTFAAPVTHFRTLEERLPSQPLPLSRLDAFPARDIGQDSRLVTAYRDLYEGRYETAARQLLLLSREYPRAPEVWALLGLVSFHFGSEQEALTYYQRAAALQPEAGSLWLLLASAEAALNRDTSREALERAVDTRPDRPEAWLLLAQTQIDAEDFEAADESLAQVTKLTPKDPKAFLLRAHVKSKLGEIEAAESAAKRSLQLEPRNARAWFLLGLILMSQEQPRQAVIAFEKTVKYDPAHPHAWMNLAHAHLATGNRTEARLAFEKHREVLAGD